MTTTNHLHDVRAIAKNYFGSKKTMPRGVPKAGKRNPGGGRSKKYGADTVQKWVPIPIASKLDELYLFLTELDSEITSWEATCEAKKTSPRYEQARKLTASVRERLDGLEIDFKGIYAITKEDECP